MQYEPEEGEIAPALTTALAEAESRLLSEPGVTGIGLGQNEIGDDAVVVYVRNSLAQRSLPTMMLGVPVVFEVTGEIKPLPV